MGGGNNPCDLILPHDFKDGSLGLQMTFPQGTAALKDSGSSSAFRQTAPLGQQHHPTQIPLDSTSFAGSAENLTKPSCPNSDRKVTWNMWIIQDLLWKSVTF